MATIDRITRRAEQIREETGIAWELACQQAEQERADELFAATCAELHADDVRRGAIRVNTERWQGRYCVLVPDPAVVGRWLTIATFTSVKQAEAFAAGYCARRDGRTL